MASLCNPEIPSRHGHATIVLFRRTVSLVIAVNTAVLTSFDTRYRSLAVFQGQSGIEVANSTPLRFLTRHDITTACQQNITTRAPARS